MKKFSVFFICVVLCMAAMGSAQAKSFDYAEAPQISVFTGPIFIGFGPFNFMPYDLGGLIQFTMEDDNGGGASGGDEPDGDDKDDDDPPPRPRTLSDIKAMYRGDD